MKAEITKDGKLAIVPETFTEEYAVNAWINDADLSGNLPDSTNVTIFLNKKEVPLLLTTPLLKK